MSWSKIRIFKSSVFIFTFILKQQPKNLKDQNIFVNKEN